jgi:hypothetical protein
MQRSRRRATGIAIVAGNRLFTCHLYQGASLDVKAHLVRREVRNGGYLLFSADYTNPSTETFGLASVRRTIRRYAPAGYYPEMRFCPLTPRVIAGGTSAMHLRSASIHPASRCPARPTNRSQAPHVQASARTQRMTQDKQLDGGPCRSHHLTPAPVSQDREETCGRATRKSLCLQNP